MKVLLFFWMWGVVSLMALIFYEILFTRHQEGVVHLPRVSLSSDDPFIKSYADLFRPLGDLKSDSKPQKKIQKNFITDVWTVIPTRSYCATKREEDEETGAIKENNRYVFISSSIDHTMSTLEDEYDQALMVAVTTLLNTCPMYGITVLMDEEKHQRSEKLQSWLEMRGVEVLPVAPKEYNPHRYHYLKLTAWELGEKAGYNKVAIFDSDMVFIRNPDPMFDECSLYFCAVLEPPSSSQLQRDKAKVIRDWKLNKMSLQIFGDTHRKESSIQFNGGLMVVQSVQNVSMTALSNHVFDIWSQIKHKKSTKKTRFKTEQKVLNENIENVQIINYEYNAQWLYNYEDVIFYVGLEMWDKNVWPRVLHLKIWKASFSFFQKIFLAHLLYNPYSPADKYLFPPLNVNTIYKYPPLNSSSLNITHNPENTLELQQK